MITNNTSITDLPWEILKNTLSLLEINDLVRVSIICSKFDKNSKEVIWDGILINNETFYSKRQVSEKKKNFFNILDRYYSLNEIEKLFTSLFNNHSASTISKLKIMNFAQQMLRRNSLKLKWNENENKDGFTSTGLIPKNVNFKTLKLENVPFDFISKIKISDYNAFKEGELVAIIVNTSDFYNKICCFGRIDYYVKSVNKWMVNFPNIYHDYLDGEFKSPGEIGKFPSDCELPSFCSM